MRRRIARSALILFFAAYALGAELDGIWAGQQAGRNGLPEDLAFRFQRSGTTVTGKMFGDEFDLPVLEGSLAGDQIRFVVTTTNYYNGSKTKFIYTGTIKGLEMELVLERVPALDDKGGNRPAAKQTIKLKRI